MVRPRRFSSASRSGSMPVSRRISEDLPWSTWPAVATTGRSTPGTRIARGSALLQRVPDRAGQPVVVVRAARCAGRTRTAPSSTRQNTGGRPSRRRAATRSGIRHADHQLGRGDARGRGASPRRRPRSLSRTDARLEAEARARARSPSAVGCARTAGPRPGAPGGVRARTGEGPPRAPRRSSCPPAAPGPGDGAAARSIEVGPAGEDAGLGAAEELVARERDHVGAVRERLAPPRARPRGRSGTRSSRPLPTS